MRAIHFNEASHTFSRYAVQHPFQCLLRAIALAALLLVLMGAFDQVADPRHSGAQVSADSSAGADETPQWVWAKRARRGGGLYPASP